MANRPDGETLMESLSILSKGIRCAQRICAIPVGGDITHEAKLRAVGEVLNVAALRSEGRDAAVSKETTMMLAVVLADVEVRLLYDRLGLTTWRPA